MWWCGALTRNWPSKPGRPMWMVREVSSLSPALSSGCPHLDGPTIIIGTGIISFGVKRLSVKFNTSYTDICLPAEDSQWAAFGCIQQLFTSSLGFFGNKSISVNHHNPNANGKGERENTSSVFHITQF